MSILQQKQEGGSVLHMTCTLWSRISPNYVFYSWSSCIYMSERTISWIIRYT